MMIYLYVLAGIVAAGAVAYFVSPTARSWMQSAWQRWFKDSEVNFAADAALVIGLLGEVITDPSFAALWDKIGVQPSTLLVFAGAIRILRMSRDRTMVPFTEERVPATKGEP